MTLIFEPDPPYLRWCRLENEKRVEYADEFNAKWMSTVLSKAGDRGSIEAVGYLLYHGGEAVTESATLLSPGSLNALQGCARFLPEHNAMTFKVARQLMSNFPDIPHILLCDTAFFFGLPPEASTYAVPYALRKKGIRRYGGYGLFHRFAWEKAQELLTPPPGKLISVYLGNHTNVAAIDNGRAVETSIGFTPVEGTISVTSCGDVDPTIVFQLMAAGMTLPEINRALTQESGFSGILNRPCTFKDIVTGTAEPGITFVREKLAYDLIRYIGAFASVLGGIDTLVVLCDDIEESFGFITRVSESLDFLGLKHAKSPIRGEEYAILTEPGSHIRVISINANRWEILNRNIIARTHKEKSQ